MHARFGALGLLARAVASASKLAMPGRLVTLARWLVLGALVGAVCGAASALFLWLLERATAVRLQHEQLVFALPVAGLVIGAVYEHFGQPIKAGSNLIIDAIHDDAGAAPPHGADGARGHRAHAPVRRQRRARGYGRPGGRTPH